MKKHLGLGMVKENLLDRGADTRLATGELIPSTREGLNWR